MSTESVTRTYGVTGQHIVGYASFVKLEACIALQEAYIGVTVGETVRAFFMRLR
jgi:hypothetical protein